MTDGPCVFLPQIFFGQRLHLLSSLQFENSLRRHSYVGLIHSLTLALAKAGQLDAAVDGARTAMKTRIEERKKKGQPMDED